MNSSSRVWDELGQLPEHFCFQEKDREITWSLLGHSHLLNSAPSKTLLPFPLTPNTTRVQQLSRIRVVTSGTKTGTLQDNRKRMNTSFQGTLASYLSHWPEEDCLVLLLYLWSEPAPWWSDPKRPLGIGKNLPLLIFLKEPGSIMTSHKPLGWLRSGFAT